MRAGASPAQLNPQLLASGDSWWWHCNRCPVDTQGGALGLAAHNETCHPGENPLGTPGRRP